MPVLQGMECPQHREGACIVFLGENQQGLALGITLLEGHVKVDGEYLAIQKVSQNTLKTNQKVTNNLRQKPIITIIIIHTSLKVRHRVHQTSVCSVVFR